MKSQTLSLKQLFINSLKEEGLDIPSFKPKKKTKKTKIKSMNFWEAVKKVWNFWTERYWSDLFSEYFYERGGSLTAYLLSSVVIIFSGVAFSARFLSLLPLIIIPLWFLTTWGGHASLLYFKDRKTKDSKQEIKKKSKEEAEEIMQTFSSYLEEKREETLEKVISQEKALEKEKELISSDIRQLKNLIDDEHATKEGKQTLLENLKPLESQKTKLVEELNKLSSFRQKVQEGINFLKEELSPKVSWNLKAVETMQRINGRLKKSNKEIERSKLLREDSVREFVQLFNLLKDKLSTVNDAYTGLLTDDSPGFLSEQIDLDAGEISNFVNRNKIKVA